MKPTFDPFLAIDHAWNYVVIHRPDLSIQARWDAAVILDAAFVKLKQEAGLIKQFGKLRRRKR